MSEVYLARAGNIGPIIEVIEGLGGNAERVVSHTSLPVSAFEAPNLLIPMRDVFMVMEHAARELDDPVFGANLGKLSVLDNLGAFGALFVKQPTLQQAIDFAISNVCEMVQEGTELKLQHDGCNAVWSYRSLERARFGMEQDAMVTLGVMVMLIKSFLPYDWLPLTIVVPETLGIATSALEDSFGTNIQRNGEAFGVLFEEDLLHHPGDATRRNCEPARRVIPMPNDLVSVALHLCDLQLHSGYPRIERVAARMGLQPRSLQRRLKEYGRTFRNISQEAIMAHAHELVLQSNRPVAKIATDLGYADSSHFSRAYKAWAGMPPQLARSLASDAVASA